jgi:hypothetical protein
MILRTFGFKSALLAAFTVLVLGVAGCDSAKPRFAVSGQVLLNGQPLKAGTIAVAPEDDKPAFGQLDAQGRFKLTTEQDGDGCVAGTHRVAVTATERTNPNFIRWLVPERYGDFHTSGLTATIDGPTDSLVIELNGDVATEGTVLIEQGDFVPNRQ